MERSHEELARKEADNARLEEERQQAAENSRIKQALDTVQTKRKAPPTTTSST